MRDKLFPISLLLFAFFFEISITTLPLIIGAFILLAVIWRSNWIFFAAFIAGIFFDILTFHSIGITSIFLVLLVFLIFLYQNKFEIETLPFVFLSSFIASGAFLIFQNYNNIFLQSFIVGIIVLGIFKLLSSQKIN